MKVGVLKTGLLGVSLAWAGIAACQQPITVTVNGAPVQFKTMPPQMVNGHVLVPLRGVFEQMGAYVHWTAATQTVEAQRGNTTVELQIGNNTAHVNQRPVMMDVAPEIMSDTTLVPLRFISEALGADVDWVSAQMTVAIRMNAGGAPDEHIHPRHADAIQPNVAQRVVVVPTTIVIPQDMVIPVLLETPLSSDRSVPGTHIGAILDTHGRPDYHGLPQGTHVWGHVLVSRRRDGIHPGILTMSFDTLVLPDGGPQIPIRGRLIGLSNESVSRAANGELVAKPGVVQSQNEIAFVGFGDNGFEFGAFAGGHVVADARIGGRYGTLAVRLKSHPEQTRDVRLARGTELGVQMRVRLDYHR